MSFNDGFNIRAVPWPPNTPVSGNSLVYNGTQWVAQNVSGSGGGGSGDITSVIAGTNLTGGGDTGDVTVSLSASVTGLTNLETTNLTASHMSGTDLKIDYIDFNTAITNPPFQTGRIHFNTDNGDLAYDTNVAGVYLNYGQQMAVKVKNATGASIAKGKLVAISGGLGNNPTIATASWDSENLSANTIGMMMNTAGINEFAYVLLNGVIEDVNTTGYNGGTLLFLSSSGDYTSTAPVPPKHAVRIGHVVREQTNNGSIFINVQNGYEINELHNVLVSSVANGDLLVYDSGNAVWKNTKTLSGSYTVTGSFTVNGKDLLNVTYQQEVFVAKNGSDSTGNGSLLNPYLTISGAMASISDATPSKRYAICVAAGDYTESGNFDIKPNVFIIGQQRDTVRISATSFRMSSLFNAGSGVDNRSGFSNCTLLNACNFDWNTVQSSAGKLYFNNVLFNSTINLNGYNNSIAQAQFDSCVIFGAFTVSGINVGRHNNNTHFSTITLNQHASLPTILVVAGGDSGNVTLTTTVNNFGRRCALFARNFWMAGLTVDGISSYADVTDSSLPSAGPTILNSGNVIYINPGSVNKALSNLDYPTAVNNPIIPATTNATNMGDWGKEWFWNFAYVFASTGNELYISTYSSSYGADSSGKDIWIVPDGAGLNTNANGGNIILQTATTSGTGTRGIVQIDARMLELTASTSLSGNVLYTPATSSHWNPQPTTIKEAIDRIAAAIYALSGNNPIT